MCAACDVGNAKSYSKGCEVSSCSTGWKVSDDKSKCEANQCSCDNGVGTSAANCPEDGTAKCESCDAGFKLAANFVQVRLILVFHYLTDVC